MIITMRGGHVYMFVVQVKYLNTYQLLLRLRDEEEWFIADTKDIVSIEVAFVTFKQESTYE